VRVKENKREQDVAPVLIWERGVSNRGVVCHCHCNREENYTIPEISGLARPWVGTQCNDKVPALIGTETARSGTKNERRWSGAERNRRKKTKVLTAFACGCGESFAFGAGSRSLSSPSRERQPNNILRHKHKRVSIKYFCEDLARVIPASGNRVS
jgi:hypothetical protein